MPEAKQGLFRVEFLVQLGIMVAAMVGIWFGLVADVQTNRDGIKMNKQQIERVQETTRRMIVDIDTNAERREARLMGQMEEIKGNVSWLVRREADRGKEQ